MYSLFMDIYTAAVAPRYRDLLGTLEVLRVTLIFKLILVRMHALGIFAIYY